MARLLYALVLAMFALPLPVSAAPDPHALFARERAASGGDAWRNVRALGSAGGVSQGGAVNPFVQVVDHDTGFSKSTTHVGSLVDVSGYDGVQWDFQGGPVSEQTLPGLAADNITSAYVSRDGWWNPKDPAVMTSLSADAVRVIPRGGNAIDVWFDPHTGLISHMLQHSDTGPVTITDDDYRTVANVIVAFRSVTRDATGSETVQQARTVELLTSVAATAFARPKPISSGTITGAVPAVVPFKLSGTPGAVIVDVHAGAHSLPVIFDSGGANLFVPAGARKLNLVGSGGLSVGGVGNASINASIVALKSLALGSAVLHDQHAILIPLPFVFLHQSRGIDVFGLVGAEFLQSFRTSFDFVAQRVRFAPFDAPIPPAHAAVLPVLSDGQHAYVRATIDGVSGLFLLDTGDSGDITVFRRFADAHGLFRGPGLPYLAVGGVGGHLPYHRYRAKTFTLGDATMKEPPVTVSDASAGSFASRSVAGNIGLRVISRYDITFDLRAARVMLSPNAKFGAPFQIDRTGASYNQPTPATFSLLSVVPGSPAAQAGLAAGSVIVAVNGTSIGAAHLGLDDIVPLIAGAKAFSLTVSENGATRVVTLHPRDLLVR